MSSLLPVQNGIAVNSREGHVPALVLRGEVTIYCAGELRDAVTTLVQHEADVVVSCEALERLDTSAVQILLMLRRELGHRGRSLRLAGVSDPIREMLRLAGIDKLLPECATAPGM